MTGERSPRWRRYLRFVRPNVPADVDDELAFHIQSRIDRNIALGMAPDDARRDALERFGEIDVVRAELVQHDERKQTTRQRAEYLADFVQDLKFGARALRRSPGFTLAAALTLALGIGANTAIFSVLNAVVLQPLPYAHPDRLVALGFASRGEYLALRQRLHAESELAIWQPTTDPVDDGRESIRLDGAAITTNLLPLLGVSPMIGRGFAPSEGTYGNNHVALISYATWRGEFGGARNILGRRLSIEGTPYTIVGVMPPSFHYPNARVAYWMPYAIDPTNIGLLWGAGGGQIIGRLAPNTTLDQARRELRVVWPSLRRVNPLWDPGPNYRTDVTVTPLKAHLVKSSVSLLWMLFGSTLLVLLIACVNVANLLLARATARERELAVRTALGGGRGRLVRQLMTEGVLLAAVGAIAGAAIALVAVRALVAAVPTGIPRAAEIAMNGTVLAFTIGVALATGVVFSIVPAIRATSGGVTSAPGAGRRATMGVPHARVAGVLVAGEVSLAVLLAIASLLLLRSFDAVRSIAPGFETAHVVAARISAPTTTYAPKSDRLSLFYQDVLRRVRALPGVRSVALVDQLPLTGATYGQAIRVQGQFEDYKQVLPYIEHEQTITPGYFATMGMPIERGRAFTDDDRAGRPPVAIVSQSVAKRYWPNGDAVGQRIGYPFDSPWITIVGVVPDTKQDSLRDTSAATLYFPRAQRDGTTQLWLVARSDGDPAALGESIRRTVRDIDRAVPVSDVRTMDAVVAKSVSGSRFTALLVAAFALLALTLGAVGIYGVMSYLVAERTREMGIRIALGASASGVIRLVVGRAARIAAAGTVCGIVGALFATRTLNRWLYGVSPTDPLTFAIVPALFLGIAVLASYAPARRATRADPATALREE